MVFDIDVASDSDEGLHLAIKLVFLLADMDGENGRKSRGVAHYAIRPETKGERAPDGTWQYGKGPKPARLIFFDTSTAKEGRCTLPFSLDAIGVADFARRWLAEVQYEREPDIDGSCEKGWRVYNEAYGHLDDEWDALIAIAPKWIEYGK